MSSRQPRLGRLIRDIGRKIIGQVELEAAFERPLARAAQIRIRPRARGRNRACIRAGAAGTGRQGQGVSAL
jgi:hypothetical protein